MHVKKISPPVRKLRYSESANEYIYLHDGVEKKGFCILDGSIESAPMTETKYISDNYEQYPENEKAEAYLHDYRMNRYYQ